MPAPDYIHHAVKNALVKDGWTITHDPFTIGYKELVVYADLRVERPLAVRRGRQERVIEVKTFPSRSFIRDFEAALGQYLIYRTFMKASGSRRRLVLAISEEVYKESFLLEAIQYIVKEYSLKLLVVRTETEEIVQWIE